MGRKEIRKDQIFVDQFTSDLHLSELSDSFFSQILIIVDNYNTSNHWRQFTMNLYSYIDNTQIYFNFPTHMS